MPEAQEFAALWQSRTAQTLRNEGYSAPTASAIDATQLALGLAAMRGLLMPGLAEMREASLATFCHGDGLAPRALHKADPSRVRICGRCRRGPASTLT